MFWLFVCINFRLFEIIEFGKIGLVMVVNDWNVIIKIFKINVDFIYIFKNILCF